MKHSKEEVMKYFYGNRQASFKQIFEHVIKLILANQEELEKRIEKLEGKASGY